MKNVTYQELYDMLIVINTEKTVVFEAATEIYIPQKDCPFRPGVIKSARINGVINFDYTKEVNKQRLAEGSTEKFEAKTRQWGIRILGTPLVYHKGKYYLEVIVNFTTKCEYRSMMSGRKIAEEDLGGWIEEKDSGHQGTKTPIVVCDYALSNITKISILD